MSKRASLVFGITYENDTKVCTVYLAIMTSYHINSLIFYFKSLRTGKGPTMISQKRRCIKTSREYGIVMQPGVQQGEGVSPGAGEDPLNPSRLPVLQLTAQDTARQRHGLVCTRPGHNHTTVTSIKAPPYQDQRQLITGTVI